MFKALKNYFVSFLFIITLLIASFTASTANAAVPQYLGYEGYLMDPSYNALSNNYNMVFRIYDALEGGSLLWTESHSNVFVAYGYFSVQLGSNTALNLDFEEPYWISIQVHLDSEMTPRQPINSVGYAYMADNTYALTDADLDTTIDASTDDQIDIAIDGADDFQFVANILKLLDGSSMETDTISETTGAAGVSIDGITLKDGNSTMSITGGTDTFNITNGTAILDVAASSTLNVDANLTVESASFVNQDLTTDASVAFTGLSNTNANITNVGDIALDSISSDGSHISIGATNDTDMLQIGDGSYTWGHLPMVGIEGILEVDGIAYFDGGISTGDTTISSAQPTLNFDDTNASDHQDNVTIYANATTTTTDAEDVDAIFSQYVAGALTEFINADADGSLTLAQANQAVAFNTSAVSGITNLDMAGTLAGVTTALTGTVNNALVISVPDQGADTNAGVGITINADDGGTGTTGGAGGGVRITAGDAQGSGANAGGILRLDGGSLSGAGADGYVSVGTGSPGHTPDEDSLFVAGILEVDGLAYFDATIVAASTLKVNDNQHFTLGSSNDVVMNWLTNGSADDLFSFRTKGLTNATTAMFFTRDIAALGMTDHDNYLSPTFVIANDEGADANDYAGVVIGERAQADVAATHYFDFYAMTGSMDGSTDPTTTELAPMFRFGDSGTATSGHSLASGDVLFEDKIEVNGTAYFDSSLVMSNGQNLALGSDYDVFLTWWENGGGDDLFWFRTQGKTNATTAMFFTRDRVGTGMTDHDNYLSPTFVITNDEGADTYDYAAVVIGERAQANVAVTHYFDFLAMTGAMDGSPNVTTTELAPMFRFGDSGSATSGHSLGAGDVLFEDDIEVDGTAYFDGGIGVDTISEITGANGVSIDGMNISNDGSRTTFLPASGSYVRIGDAQGTNHNLTDEDDLMVTGDFEVDGTAYFDGGVFLNGGALLFGNDITLTGAIGRDTDNELNWGTNDSLAIVIGGTTHNIVSITAGAGDNDKLVTQGYVDDAGRFGNTTTVDGATYDLLVTDYILAIDRTSAGAHALTLPTAQCDGAEDNGRQIYIVDTGGNADPNSITVDTEGGEKISGEDTQVISADYNSLSLTCYSSDWYIF